jgi:MSHA biogenesis protein MshJ
MKEWWRPLAAKFDALTLRERLLVLAGLIVGIVSIYHYLVLDPLSVQKRRLTQQLGAAHAGIQAIESAQKAQVDPDAVKRSYRDALRRQVAEIDKTMQGLQQALVPPDQMAKLLEGMLTGDHALQLVSLHKLPVQRLEASGMASEPPNAPSTAAVTNTGKPGRRIYQHSFEVTVQGSYVDLHDYLARLEKLPWQMFWGRASMNAEQYPKLTLSLTVHTLSFDKAWLII